MLPHVDYDPDVHSDEYSDAYSTAHYFKGIHVVLFLAGVVDGCEVSSQVSSFVLPALLVEDRLTPRQLTG